MPFEEKKIYRHLWIDIFRNTSFILKLHSTRFKKNTLSEHR